jgi:hypothetical protein
MSCERFEDRLVELACGELSPEEARQVEAHALSCPACDAALSGMRATRRTMAALGQEPAPDAGERLLLAAGHAQAQRNAARRRRWIGLFAAPVAVAAGLAIAVSWPLLSDAPGSLGRDDPDALVVKRGAPVAERDEAAAPAEPTREEPAREEPARYAQGEPPAAAPPDGRFAVPPPSERSSRPAAPARKAAPPAEDTRSAEAAPGAGADPDTATRDVEPLPGALAQAPAAREAEEPATAAPAPAPAPAQSGGARAAASRAERRSARPAAAESSEAPAPQAAPSAPRATAADASPAEAARARYDALRAAGQLRGEIRTYPGCEGEAWRKVETDPQGRVVRYVREGRLDGRRLRVEHLYDEGGALVEAEAVDLDAAGAGRTPARALGLDVPLRAEAAAAGAAPRCDR